MDAIAFARMHPKDDSRGGSKDHLGPPPLIEGTVIGVNVEHLPGIRPANYGDRRTNSRRSLSKEPGLDKPRISEEFSPASTALACQ